MTIVVQIMDIQFKTTGANALQKGIRKVIALFGNHLERTPDTVALVQIHQGATKSSAFLMFDVMGHKDATLVLIRPEPDERNSLVTVRFDGQRHELRAQIVNRLINGPGGELNIFSLPQMKSLKILADAHGKERTSCVICLSDQLFGGRGGFVRDDISFPPKVVQYFVHVKRQL